MLAVGNVCRSSQTCRPVFGSFWPYSSLLVGVSLLSHNLPNGASYIFLKVGLTSSPAAQGFKIVPMTYNIKPAFLCQYSRPSYPVLILKFSGVCPVRDRECVKGFPMDGGLGSTAYGMAVRAGYDAGWRMAFIGTVGAAPGLGQKSWTYRSGRLKCVEKPVYLEKCQLTLRNKNSLGTSNLGNERVW